MDYKELIEKRRSCRTFTNEEIEPENVQMILRAALLSPSAMNRRAWQFIVVDDKQDLEKLSDAKEAGSKLLKNAAMAVVVLGDVTQNDCWVEDGSIAAISMQYQAEELNIGSCWVEIRGRRLSDGTESESIVRGILQIPEQLSVLCIIGFGKKAQQAQPRNLDELKWENVHINKYDETKE